MAPSISAVLLLLTFGAAVTDNIIVLDGSKQLFLDDHLITAQTNITRTIHPAQKHPNNPIVFQTEPWEGDNVLIYGSVIREGSKFRMWYYASGYLAYAESDDGLHWRKPVFDIIRKDGRDTNLLVECRDDPEPDKRSVEEYEAGVSNAIPHYNIMNTVFLDPLDPDPQRRYKMTYCSFDFSVAGVRRGLGIAGSPDGIHWKLIRSFVSDTSTDSSHSMLDLRKREYVHYGRTAYYPPGVEEVWSRSEWVRGSQKRRAVARIASKDGVNWDYTEYGSSPVSLSADLKDPVGTEIYDMMVFPYESVYIGIPRVFYNRSPGDAGTLLEPQLAVSHDGVTFSRVGDRSAFIPCGAIGEWDRFNNEVSSNPPIEMGDELWFYYCGRLARHKHYADVGGKDSGGGRFRNCIGLATVRRDRFVSLGASFDGGTITTKPVRLAGDTVHLNAKARFGSITVEVDKNGTVLVESLPVANDALDTPVHWKDGQLNSMDIPVTLRITLKNALLFAIWCE
jgi:hypothetical protein